MTKKRVLLTGASGSMGSEAFKELLRRKDKYDIVVILRLSKKNKEMFAKWEAEPGVRIVWGDLCELKDVQEAMKGVEHVLHPAAFISPEADMNPVQPLAGRLWCRYGIAPASGPEPYPASAAPYPPRHLPPRVDSSTKHSSICPDVSPLDDLFDGSILSALSVTSIWRMASINGATPAQGVITTSRPPVMANPSADFFFIPASPLG
jgi:hypothetical protein